MPDHAQVLRFAVGSPAGPRSRSWRVWVPKAKSDVYISSRRLGSSVKVSLHEPGPSTFALTNEWVSRTGFQAPEGRHRRLAFNWLRPRTRPPNIVARPFTIIVPWDEVLDREAAELGDVIWLPPPPQDHALHIDVVYVPANMPVTGHPGARSMGTGLVGELLLHNGERVFLTHIARPIQVGLRNQIAKLRSAQVLDAQGRPLDRLGMMAFGAEPNPDADDGTQIGMLLDVTRPPAQ
jgi:hypothetical protein